MLDRGRAAAGRVAGHGAHKIAYLHTKYFLHSAPARPRLVLWARAAGERAVDVQITRLRRKIEADPKAPLYIQTVRGSGYKLVADPVYDGAEP